MGEVRRCVGGRREAREWGVGGVVESPGCAPHDGVDVEDGSLPRERALVPSLSVRFLRQTRHELSRLSPPPDTDTRQKPSTPPSERALTRLATAAAATGARTQLAPSRFPWGGSANRRPARCAPPCPSHGGSHPNGCRARSRLLTPPLSEAESRENDALF